MLPVELLFEIFALDTDPGTLMTLAAVCRQWKDVIYNAPSLWTELSIARDTTAQQLHVQLERSSSRCLDVHIHFAPSQLSAPGPLRELCGTVLAEYTRVECLSIVSQRGYSDEDEDESDDGLDADEWPPEVVRALTSRNTWPRLRTLELSADANTGTLLDIHIVAPALQKLRLDGVSAHWTRIGASALREVDVEKSVDVYGLVAAMHSWPNLRRLQLIDDDRSDEPLAFLIPLARSTAETANLVDFCVWWIVIDIQNFLHVLSCCPRLEQLKVWVTHFENHDARLDADFQLRHLETLHIRISSRSAGTWTDVLRALLPAIRAAKLRDLDLDNVDISGCETVLGADLECLSLNEVKGNAPKLVQALGHCAQLREVHLAGARLSSLDESWAAQVKRLQLHTATFSVREPPAVPGSAPDSLLTVLNQNVIRRLVLSLVDTQTIPFLIIYGLPLATQEVEHIFKGIGTQPDGPLSLALTGSPSGRTRFKIGVLPSHEGTSTGFFPVRCFEAESSREALHVLDSAVSISANVAFIALDLQQALGLFVALSATSVLFRLLQLSINVERAADASVFHATLEAIVGLRGDVVLACPSMADVRFESSGARDLRVSKDVVDRFMNIFRPPARLVTIRIITDPDVTFS